MDYLEFYIAHEYENPTNLFFYRPIKVTTNLLKVKILDDYQINFDKLYQFYLNLEGLNFTLLGKPIRKTSSQEVLFLIKESRIELRKYPRIKTESLAIKVFTGGLQGKLMDFSLGGCRIRFETPIPPLFYKSSSQKTLTIETPEGEPVKITAYIVNVNPKQNSISFSFPKRDAKILKLYTKISEYLKRRKKEIEE